MKKKFTISIKILTLLVVITHNFISCDYDEFKPAEYTTSKLYMPASVRGIFTIDNVPQRVEWLPTPGYAYDFKIDKENNKFIVPLGVYRSGIERKGDINVNIEVKNDTVNMLKSSGKIPGSTVILPSNQYSLPTSVTVKNGSEIAGFDLEINLGYLLSHPNEIFAIGVGISSDKLEVNQDISTTIIVIHTKLLVPTADFIYSINGKTVTFTNESGFGMKYLWNFGDGRSNSKNPSHTFSSSGNYIVTLTTEGVLGPMNQAIAERVVVIP
jgi:PKD repeat protein